MIKTATFLKATATTLTTCILAACGGDSSSSNTIEKVEETPKTSFTYKTETHEFTVSSPNGGVKEGKSVFNLNVKDTSGTVINAVMPNMIPTMVMDETRGGHKHSTPSTGCTATDIDGNSKCTTYFLMPSKMANGTIMGEWDLTFSLPDTDGEIKHSPDVMMYTMSKAQLKGGTDDQIPKMNMSAMNMSMSMMDTAKEARTYYIFNNGITKTGSTSSVELFLAAKETMMSFPVVKIGSELNSDLTVTSIDLKVSSDNETWVNADTLDAAKGTWKAAGIANLTNTLFIKLSVNGDVKTTDGDVAGEDNSSTQISLTAAM